MPGACLDGMAGQCPRGWPGAAWGSLHRAPLGAPHHRQSTHTWTTASMHNTPSVEIQRGVRSAAAERRFPEWDPTTDLLAEEATTESVRWRSKRAQRGAFHPWWRRQSPQESPGDSEATRVAQEPECGEERGVEEGLGWVGLTDPDPSRLGSTSRVGWVGPVGQGPLVYLNQIQNFKLWF
jgi:hypothetical protein